MVLLLASHRDIVFREMPVMLDEIKSKVPIWKKAIFFNNPNSIGQEINAGTQPPKNLWIANKESNPPKAEENTQH